MLEGKKKVVVIGGGITGLTAAYYLQKAAKNVQLPLAVTLIEAAPRLGGKIQTVKKDGFVIERGPDSFLERKESAARLAREVGLGDQLVNNAAGQSYVLVNNKLHPMPSGSVMGIPTRITPFMTTTLFSIQGKVRAGADFLLPKSGSTTDQSLGGFFRRRLGDEVVENLIEPLLSGIYAGDIDKLSLMSTFPQFYEVEQKYRSLIFGMKKTTPASAGKGTKKKGIFLTLKNGLEELVEAIESKLESGSVLKGTRVDYIEKREDGKIILSLNSGKQMLADSVIITTPHFTLPAMMPQYHFFNELKEMPAASVATVAMAFPEEAISQDIDGTGFVVSRNSDFTITACTWTHKKWPHTVPKGKVLLRCYVGRAGDEAVVDLADAEIERIVLDDLNKTMSITAEPDFMVVSRWKKAMPQYTIGHQQRLNDIEEHLQREMPGLFIGGSSFKGLGLPDCIDQGEEVVQKALAFIQKKG
ncbi:protoporphyrinogen oxidase [Bacillus aerolatus]|uniref:Coproporphyrinogen III oxidase n=1 Tax=Bacillus aerolatus TaxID=2653354 RepID=A0A6I1FCE9_9BACI|nr:protoporphyrinogen oxidase [Bacillus aerolatus]KAB7704958.1 protoporphyrinogen oxidase [Bacillus aerolatus]